MEQRSREAVAGHEGLAILGRRDTDGCTPVHIAAMSSMQLENVKLMLKHTEGEAALSVTDTFMMTPLLWALVVGNTEGSEAMLQYEQVQLIYLHEDCINLTEVHA